MTVVVVVDDQFSILLTPEYVNHEEAYILHVSSKSLQWSVWTWKTINNNNDNNNNNDHDEMEFDDSNTFTTTTITSPTNDKKRKLSFQELTPKKR